MGSEMCIRDRYQPGRISGFTFGLRSSTEPVSGIALEWGIANATDQYVFKIYAGQLSIVRRSTVPLSTEVLVRNGLDPSELISVGDSGTDLSMKIKGSKFIGFNPTRERAVEKFEDAGVPIVKGKDLRMIWKYIFPEEGGYPS